jgi:hypothetical protein
MEKVKSTTGVVHMLANRKSANGHELTWCMSRVTEKWTTVTDEKLTCPHCIRGNGYKA